MQSITVNETLDEQNSGDLLGFTMTLRPRRSADPRVAYTACGVLGFIWLCAGTFFVTMGGWPVMGFFGAEFIFIAGMVHIFIKRTEMIETVEITSGAVTVSRRELGVSESKTFHPYWAQVHFGGSDTENASLKVRSHGESITIGNFLSAAEKQRTAHQLSDVLYRLKSVPPEN